MIAVEPFEAGMRAMADHFSRVICPEQLGNYSIVLDPFLTSEQFTRAAAWVCEMCVRMPSPGDLLDIALDLPAEVGEVA